MITTVYPVPGATTGVSARIFVSLASIFFLVYFTPSLAAPSAGGDCQSCHTASEHAERLAAQSNDCHACHSESPVLLAKVTELTDKTTQDAATTKDLLPGMSIPMYYNESRLGGEPNKMVLIPRGKFLMGTDERLPDEGPQHEVELPPFYIDRYEVTNLQYKKFIDDTNRRSPKHFSNRTFPAGKADHPVVYVSWKDASAYCAWAGKRLPTDREWEKAARGTDGRTYPWGNAFEMHAANTPVRWAKLKQDGDTTPVGAFVAGKSPFGVYDMSGNVWEWTDSWYKKYPGNTRDTENYGEIYKTLKGGSWWDCSFYKCGISAPVYNRSFFSPRVKNSSFGFRCARDGDTA